MKNNIKNTYSKRAVLVAILIVTSVGCKKSAEDALSNVTSPIPGQPNKPVQEAVSFKEWKEFIGQYRLTQFNGQSVDGLHAEITESMSHFYDRKTQRYLNSVIFPLFASVTSGSSVSYKLGPIDQKDETQVTTGQGLKMYSYVFEGEINLQGVDVKMQLNLQVIQEKNNLYITYKLNMPGQVSEIERNFTLQKK